MKKIPLLILSIFLCSLTGCGPTMRSSGLLVENIKKYGDVEIRYPKKVLVLSSGNVEPITNRAAKIFREGLGEMGFDVVEPKPVYDEFDIEDLELSMFTEEIGSEEIKQRSEEIRKSLADKFGIDGAFTLYVHGIYFEKPSGMFTSGKQGSPPESPEEMGGRRWFTKLSVFLHQIPKGHTLWKCNTEYEQLFESTWEDSIEWTTKAVLRYLESDIEKIK